MMMILDDDIFSSRTRFPRSLLRRKRELNACWVKERSKRCCGEELDEEGESRLYNLLC